jgi:nicotinate dehydrogenase subunit A
MADPRTLTINGVERATGMADGTPLLDVLRAEFGLMATRFGCGAEQCGTCMVLVDGTPTYSCTRPVETLAGADILTLEGLGTVAAPHPLQLAFLEEQAGQCGYCLSGILMSAKALLDRTTNPTRAEIAAALDGHLCRCGAHNRIIKAIERAATTMRAGARL